TGRGEGGAVQPALPVRHRPARQHRPAQGDAPRGGAPPDAAARARDRRRRGRGEPMSEENVAEAPRRASRKVREGIVVSSKMDKTVVVAVVDRVQHRRYRKTVQRTRKLYAHDEANDVREGDRVRISETRPLSRQ